MPVSASMRERNSPPLRASRVALVAAAVYALQLPAIRAQIRPLYERLGVRD